MPEYTPTMEELRSAAVARYSMETSARIVAEHEARLLEKAADEIDVNDPCDEWGIARSEAADTLRERAAQIRQNHT